MRSECLAGLLNANWQLIASVDWPFRSHVEWIADNLSMTLKLKQHCEALTVQLLTLQQQDKTQLTPDERNLLGNQDCLVREVLLHGDGQPWLYARTLIPASSLVGEGAALASLGTQPLGELVFGCENHRRDRLVAAWVLVQHQRLLARRSRLWLNDKPMLVNEIFLPNSPVYGVIS